MIIILEEKTSQEECNALKKKLEWMGFVVMEKRENGHLGLAVVKGEDKHTKIDQFSCLPHVKKVLPFKSKSKLVSREFKNEDTIIEIKGHKIGGGHLTVMAGPCSIESKEQIMKTAEEVAASGASVLRGGAFKPRTSPYDFQGLGEEGLKYLQEAGEKYGLLTITEVMDEDQIELAVKYVDILQVGTRNMQNFSLLKKLGKAKKPVFLKRGFSASYQDFLMAAEYIVANGNPHVILCERGIRTFETYTRNTLDLAAVPILKKLSHLPVIADPSHGTGIRELISPMSRASIAAGADGLMIEVHPNPDESLSDAKQTISFTTFANIMHDIKNIFQLLTASQKGVS